MPSMDDDYLERARELWHQCQFYVYVGLAMILATITGFTLSHSSYDENRDYLNDQLYRLIDSADDGARDEALAAYEALQQDEEFNELDYLGAFVLSSLYFSEGEFSQAAEVLQPALDGSEDDGMRQLAALRIAESLIGGGDFSAAVTLLTDNMPAEGRMQIMFYERIGDAENSAGNLAAASAAYQNALALAEEAAAFYQPVLNIKLGAMLSSTEAAQAALAGDDSVAGDDGDDDGSGDDAGDDDAGGQNEEAQNDATAE